MAPFFWWTHANEMTKKERALMLGKPFDLAEFERTKPGHHMYDEAVKRIAKEAWEALEER